MSTEEKGIMRYLLVRNVLKESFSLKLFRSFAVSIVFVLLVSTPLYVFHQNRIVKEELVKEGKMLADLLAFNSRTGVFAENRALLSDAVQGIMKQKNVSAVSIFTAGGDLLISEQKDTHRGDPGIAGDRKELFRKPDEGTLLKVIDGEGAIAVVAPVLLEVPGRMGEDIYFDEEVTGTRRNVIGYVDVVMSKEVISHEIAAILFRSALIALAFLFAGGIVIYLAIRKVTQPLTKLTEAVQSLGAGETVEKVSVASQDEIGRLATSFNAMYDSLLKREEEKNLLEERLRHSQKMEAIGTLARGIAHDFNNILSTVQGSVYMLEKRLGQDIREKQYIGQMHNSLDKAKSLIQGLITFSKLQNVTPGPADINGIIRRLKPMLTSIAGDNVRLNYALQEKELTVLADKLQIEQILMNLCSNARDAMPDGGICTVETERVEEERDRDVPGREINPGRYALVTVRDTGTGMDDETRERMFEPFFTTKEVGKGTGLGLSIVFGIVEQLRGHIAVHTGRGEGTAFNVYLPLLEKSGENLDNKTTA
jgi:signal transduction histidine kinase